MKLLFKNGDFDLKYVPGPKFLSAIVLLLFFGI